MKAKERKKEEVETRGGRSEAKGHPEPHTKHLAFFFILALIKKVHLTFVQSQAILCLVFFTKKKYNPRSLQIPALTSNLNKGHIFQRGRSLFYSRPRT